jgi:Protein of unknown function (DUF4236)
MGFFRFRRSIRILPGVRVNLSKSGVSTSVGVRGAQVTFGHDQVRTTVGLPGTGLSYTDVRKVEAPISAPPAEAPPQGRGARTGLGLLLLLGAVGAAIWFVAR